MSDRKPPAAISFTADLRRRRATNAERERDRREAGRRRASDRSDGGVECAARTRRGAKPASRTPAFARAPRWRAAAARSRRAGDAVTPRPAEQRLYGLNACLAVFANRPASIRKVWLVESRIPKLKAVLAHCVQQRLGYTVVEDADLEKLSGSAHHEGVLLRRVAKRRVVTVRVATRPLQPGPATALWLDGVGNPHNFGAILRSAAHFGAAAVLLPKDSELSVSGAAARVAEGGAEAGADGAARAQRQRHRAIAVGRLRAGGNGGARRLARFTPASCRSAWCW